MTYRYAVTLISAALLAACQSTPAESPVERDLKQQMMHAATPAPDSAKPAETPTIPADVAQALMNQPASALSGPDALYGPQKFDVDAQQVDVRAFFAALVDGTPFSAAIHPQVTGNISLSLKQVTMAQVMDLLQDLYGYDIQRKDTVYQVRPAGMRTETFAVNYLLMKRDGSTQTSIISGGVSQNADNNNNTQGNQFNDFTGNSAGGGNLNGLGGGTNNNGTAINTRTETDFWSTLQESLTAMVGSDNGRAVFVTPQAGLVTVRALPQEIQDIKTFLKVSETHLQRQVVLEARILEVELKDDFQQGINWNQIIASAGSTEFNFSTTAGNFGNQITSALGGVTSLSFLNEDFTGVLSLLSTQGDVQVLSSPRVTATNNQKAVIKVGDDEYFVTEVSSQNTITSTSTSVVPNIELTPFFSGIALDVTPQIDEKGSVLLHVHPSVIETEEQEKVLRLNDEQIVLPLAQSTIRESDTVIRAASGEIVVIGGLMQTSNADTESKTPLLGDIPVLGNLFKSRRATTVKKELIILLKPTVVGPGTWAAQMEASRAQMADWLYVE